MVHHSKKKHTSGFTLVELIVVLAITAILAALVGGGLIGYIRLARFEKNEANARTLFQTAQLSLTRMDTAGALDDFREKVVAQGDFGSHFADGLPDAEPGSGRTRDELDAGIAALYYDKNGPDTDNNNALVEELLGEYIYDASLLDASICVEIDAKSGQVYSVFYDTNAQKLRFDEKNGATNIFDRSYEHRRGDSLVGYYSAEDRVNVVELQQTKLKVKNPRLSNGETLTLSWSSGAKVWDEGTQYIATAYDKADTAQAKPLFQITITSVPDTGENKQSIVDLKVIPYENGTAGDEETLSFPLSYNKGSFVLTLDAMMDAATLRAVENSDNPATAYGNLFSITRLVDKPEDIYFTMVAEPQDNYTEIYTASNTETTNIENTLLAAESTAKKGDIKYFRHLYNLRWADTWGLNGAEAVYTLHPQATNSTGLNWTSGGVTVYCAAGNSNPPEAKTPTANNPVAWPTIPKLSENITLESELTAENVARVPILNLQLNGSSIAKAGKQGEEELADHYIGLVGQNAGTIQHITLQDVDMQVNVTEETVTTLADTDLALTTTTVLRPLDTTDTDYRDIRAAGALCGVNTGTLTDCALIRGSSANGKSRVQAALHFDDTTTQKTASTATTADGKYTYTDNEPRGIGGLVGVAMPESEKKMTKLSVTSGVTVAGVLVDDAAAEVVTSDDSTAATALEYAEMARYTAASAEPDAESTGDSLWRSVGVGGVFGTLDAANLATEQEPITNAATVVGSGFTGGVAGNIYNSDTAKTVELTYLSNSGTVAAGTGYTGDKPGASRSKVLGQFFGGVAGYAQDVSMTACSSATRTDLTEAELESSITQNYGSDGRPTPASPLKGDFVGGLVGFGKNVNMQDCSTSRGYVLGERFVGGLAGGFAGGGTHTGSTNVSAVFGNRYVGGIVSVNGRGSSVSKMENKGLMAGLGQQAAYVGGIAGMNAADWGAQDNTIADTATVLNCNNSMSGDDVTDSNRVALLQRLSRHDNVTEYATCVGGLVGCNGKNGVITWDKDGDPSDLGGILYGDSLVGGVAGYNSATATITNSNSKTIVTKGRVVATGDAVGGFVGMNCADSLPAATVSMSLVQGRHFVGGVIGANLPMGSGFAVLNGGRFNTNAASGSVVADGVAGGIIGYNRLLEKGSVTIEELTSRKDLLPTIDKSNGVLTASKHGEPNKTDSITLNGFANTMNLYANAYVGGIVGYNDADTHLTIEGATNGATNNASSVGSLTKGTAVQDVLAHGVQLSALAGDRYDFGTAGRTDGQTDGVLAGGIIGYASQNTTLTDCVNYGIVNHACAAGGLAGWNEGTISGGTMDAALGSRQSGYDYLGGIAGVNGGTITDAFPTANRTISGNSAVGGMAGVNLTDAVIVCTQTTNAAAVSANENAGGAAGVNNGTVNGAGGTFALTVTADANAGGIAGLNNGTIAGGTNGTTSNYAVVTGRVTAQTYAGGAAGRNYGTITLVNNQSAAVRANNTYAGGIAGENNGTISASLHRASGNDTVYATNGYAGGIAGVNQAGASIYNVTVSAAVKAANGEAGGIAAENYGQIGLNDTTPGGTIAGGTTVSGTADSIGAAVVYNQSTGKLYGVTLVKDAGIGLNSRATTVGGLAGRNLGEIDSCTVNTGALDFSGLTAGSGSVTLGGAVGVNEANSTVKNTTVEHDFTDKLDKFTNLGGVAGRNDGTLYQCVYSGKISGTVSSSGVISGGAAAAGRTAGGIAGLNNGTVEGCTVSKITLQVQGASNVADTQTADQKLQNASHVGGIVGRNNATIKTSYIANENGSLVAARYGFVGGVAGSNSGTITQSGSGEAMPLVKKVGEWLNNDKSEDLVTALVGTVTTNGETGKDIVVTHTTDYDALKGVDTVSSEGYGYSKVYTDGLNQNRLTVVLRGDNDSETARVNGYLGGITGFNAVSGSIDNSATGKWFVYADNVSADSTVGGIIGQNESDVTDKNVLDTVVNCAAVRRFTRVKSKEDTDKDNLYYTTWNEWKEIVDTTRRVDVQVGGIICTQNNRSDDRWVLKNCVNFGSVFNSRSFNVGGVISLWTNYGGTLDNCYNFGLLQSNMNDKAHDGADCGTMGGIVAYYDAPISNTAVNILSCQNHGSMTSPNPDNTANDIGGIFGKVQMKNATDYMTVNLYNCVNGSSVVVRANSMVAGIFGYLGPWAGVTNDEITYVENGRDGYTDSNTNTQFKTVPNVTINITRCRNYTVNMYSAHASWDNDSLNASTEWVAGIVGTRSEGGYSVSPTTLTDCFAFVRDTWHPLVYDKRPSTIVTVNGVKKSGEHVEGENNYYISVGNAQNVANSYKNTTNYGGGYWNATGVVARNLTHAATSAVNGVDTANDFFDERGETVRAGGARLYLGIDTTTGTDYKYFAMLPTMMSGKINYDMAKLDKNSGYIAAKDETGAPGTVTADTTHRYVFGQNNTALGQLLLLFNEKAGDTSLPDLEDITDDVIQRYYATVLDSTKPGKPKNIQVIASQETDEENNVYGRYEVTWDKPQDESASPAAYYHVEILPCNEDGTVDENTDAYLTADVYERRYTFIAEKAWQGKFIVRITPYNTNTSTTVADNYGDSGVQTFLHALPTPQIEVRLVRNPDVVKALGATSANWNDFDGNYPWAYEQVVTLTNYDDYPTDDVWKVEVTLKNTGSANGGKDDTYTFDANTKTQKGVRRVLGTATKITAIANPKTTDTEWMRSGQYSNDAFIPSTWLGVAHTTGNNDNDGTNAENGLAPGTLTSKVTVDGTSVDDMAVNVNLSFTPKNAAQGSPVYRVMLTGRYNGNDSAVLDDGTTIPLKGQFVTLASQEVTVTTATAAVRLSGLPTDSLSNYSDLRILALPINSGLGHVSTRWSATDAEVKALYEKYNTYGSDNAAMWYRAAIEIVRKTDGTGYEFAHFAPLGFAMEDHTSTQWWAKALTEMQQIVSVKLTDEKTILAAPTLDEKAEGTLDAANELTYTFGWTQSGLNATDNTPKYTVTLYGLYVQKDENGNIILDDNDKPTVTSAEQIRLGDNVDLAKLVQPQGTGGRFTLPLNIDRDLYGGSESWRYDYVRLEVARVADNATDLGAAAEMDYPVKQRLQKVDGGLIGASQQDASNADAAYYRISWTAVPNADHYDLYMADEDGNILNPNTPWQSDTNSCIIDLEQYQGQTLRFRVVSCTATGDTKYFDGPNSDLGGEITVTTRLETPKGTNAAFAQGEPSQTEFLTQLQLNMALAEQPDGNIYFTGYLFADADKYEEVRKLAATWQSYDDSAENKTAKAAAKKELDDALAAALESGAARLVIPTDQRTVGTNTNVTQSGAGVNYTFRTTDKFLTLTPGDATGYLLPAVRLMRGTDRPSGWYYYTDALQLPAILLDSPVNAADPTAALSHTTVTHQADLYTEVNGTGAPLDRKELALEHLTLEWQAVNAYTPAEGETYNLTDTYQFTVTPMQGDAYTITVVTYPRNKYETAEDGTQILAHKRGEIKTVTKTATVTVTNEDGTETTEEKTYELPVQENGGRRYYDLSMTPVYEVNESGETVIARYVSNPSELRGMVNDGNNIRYYKTTAAPELEAVLADDAEPTYRLTLPDLQSKLQAEDALELQKITQSIALGVLTGTEEQLPELKGKTQAPDAVTVEINKDTETTVETYAAPAAEAPAVQAARPVQDTQTAQGNTPAPAAVTVTEPTATPETAAAAPAA